MEANDYLKAMQAMDELDRIVTSVYPDKFKLVCKKHGIDECEAMNMYSYLQKMQKGQSWLVRYKPLEYLERVLTLAKEAYASYMNNGLILSMVNFGDKYTRILVIFEKDGVRSQLEFDLREQRTYVDIADFIGNGYSIVSVIPQSDNVGSEKFVGEKDERSHSIPIYDGDVMLCYVNKPEFWSSDWRNSGLYICESGSYHRLLYTPNKGYVRHGEPDVDEDFTLDIGEESFSSYVMTLDQSWYKLGNIYAGIGFLKEKE